MPELGQNRSPGALLPRGQHGPPVALGQRGSWVHSGSPRGGCSVCSGSHLAPQGGTQIWGTLGLATSLWMAPPDSWHVAPMGLNGEGREGTSDSIPLTLSQGWPARFQAAPAVPGVGPFPQRGCVIAGGPPWKINALRPGRTARHRNSPAGRGSAGLFAFGTTPRRSGAQHKYLYG